MSRHKCDVAIIGAGTAGLVAERSARAAGAKTLLIDEKFAGTVCATVGCMPSKLLIAAATAAHSARKAQVFGIKTEKVTVDGPAVMQRLRAERDAFVSSTLTGISELPDGVCIKAKARFIGPNTLSLDNGDEVEAKAIVIATGSFPAIPKPFEGLGDVLLTNRTVFEMKDLPKSLAVVGGGPIGLEMTQAMARLGVETVLFDRDEVLGGVDDADIQKNLLDVLTRDATVHLGVDIVAERQGAQVKISWSGASEGSKLFDKVLIATGRPPCLANLDLQQTNLELDSHGGPVFDCATLQCGDAPIFIAGDANGDVPLLHEALHEGSIAGQNAARFPDVAMFTRHPAFSLTFTDPPLVSLGEVTNAQSISGCADYSDQGRAKVEAKAQGLVRLFATKSGGRLIGAQMFAPGADHLAHLLILAIKREETARGLLGMPFYHPTLEEGLKPALREICDASDTVLPV
ncbi:dihydrolipoyl dehydrogenase [Pseudorhodobacter aquimaris]|uniref:dihydrolipoyl dehydrogenase n=1 Tax=Pseudorhodobacter aquimaris TaxID=687412 RepID=UPI00067BED95|nr:dihydrolipoyl dehydrogenase [Pseudorhodobacter aquimaris]